MSDWRKILWQMPAPEPNDINVLDKFKIDVRTYILNNIDPHLTEDEDDFNEAYQEFLSDVADTNLSLNEVLFYFKKGYEWFVKRAAEDVYDIYNV